VNIVTQTAAWLSDPIHWSGPNGIPVRLFEHVIISSISLVIALAIALPIGLYIGHTGRLTNFAVNSANLWRALPSLAVIAIVLPLTTALDPQLGFKVYPTVVAMVVLAVPPILVNAYAGLASVDRDMLEAARGQGMSERQILGRVELPLAVPVIATGIRSATIQVVATATLGAVFGFGGLGRYLVDGISQNDDRPDHGWRRPGRPAGGRGGAAHCPDPARRHTARPAPRDICERRRKPRP
jgi:osmoprotectant transport system permease protein